MLDNILKHTFLPFLLLMLVSSSAWAETASVKVIALFTNKAMLVINDKNIIMKKGQVEQGVTLVSANGRGAVVRFENGVEKKLGINQSIQQAYKKPEKNKLTIYSNNRGMFLLPGKINGRPTNFLLDTGATSIALSSEEADKLGLSYRSARETAVQTASEVVPAWQIKLDKVKVGEISVSNVEAVVLKGSSPRTTLLGMSFLKHLKLQRNGAAMLIEQKY